MKKLLLPLLFLIGLQTQAQINQNDTIICFGDSISLSLSNIPQSNSISWTETYVEDFEDGQAQGWNIYNGEAGG